MKLPPRIISNIAQIALVFFLTFSAAFGAALGRARFSWEAVPDPIVSGYKVYWGTQSRVYTQTVDAGNATELIGTGFSEGVAYFAAITAYSNTGEESDYSTELSFVYDSIDRLIFLEAENGVLTAPMQIVTDGSTTGVAASPANPTAAATLSFNTPYAADYYVWCRVLAASVSADSMFVTLDQLPEQVYYVYGEPSPPAAVFMSRWTWSRIQVSPGIAQPYPLEAGSHSIRFRCRDNTWLDRVVIVCNPDFVPSDALPRSGDVVTVVGQPQGGTVPTGGGVTLTATLVATGPLTMEWFHDGIALPNSNQSSLTLSNVQAANGGSYALSAWINSTTVTSQPVTVTVEPAGGKATPLITTKPIAADIVYGQTLASSTLSGGAASAPGRFAFTSSATAPAVGTTLQSVTFTPTDTATYQSCTTMVSVTVAIASESLETWRTRCFSAEQIAAGLAADDADPDGDGLVNLAEYALGTDPHTFTTPMAVVKPPSGLVVTFIRPRGLPDVLYSAESSDDLIHWNPCLLELIADGPVQTMRARDPVTSGNPARRFISLRFTRP